MLINKALEMFFSEYCYDHSYHQGTINNYKWAIGCLLKVVGNIEVEQIDLESIRRFKRHMESKNFERSALISYLYRIRFFLKWYGRNHKLSLNTEDIVIPKNRRKLVSYLDPQELERMINVADTREKAIIAVLYSTAIRVGELTQIRIKDIRGDTICVRGKGDKEREVFLDSTARKCIHDYLASREDCCPFLLYSHKKGGLQKSAIQRLVRGMALKAGIDKHVTPHLIRHSAATELLKNNVNLRYIQEYLGHADISTTQMYTHVARTDLKTAIESGHTKLALSC